MRNGVDKVVFNHMIDNGIVAESVYIVNKIVVIRWNVLVKHIAKLHINPSILLLKEVVVAVRMKVEVGIPMKVDVGDVGDVVVEAGGKVEGLVVEAGRQVAGGLVVAGVHC